MAEVILDETQVVPLVGQCEPARMTKHVWVDRLEPGADGGGGNQIIHGLPGQRLTSLGNEQPRQRVLSGGEVAPERPQFVAGDRLLDRQPALEAPHPQTCPVEIDFVTPEGNGFADPKAVAEHHEQQQMIARTVTAALGCVQQRGDLTLIEEVLRALVSVRRVVRGR
jgi:hypothetical protein